MFLRAVETRLGPSEGKLTLKHAGGELTAPSTSISVRSSRFMCEFSMSGGLPAAHGFI